MKQTPKEGVLRLPTREEAAAGGIAAGLGLWPLAMDITIIILLAAFMLIVWQRIGGKGGGESKDKKVVKLSQYAWLLIIAFLALAFVFPMFLIPAMQLDFDGMEDENGPPGTQNATWRVSMTQDTTCADINAYEDDNDCWTASEGDLDNNELTVNVLLTITQQNTANLDSDQFAIDFAVERTDDGVLDPGSGTYMDAVFEVDVEGDPTLRNATLGTRLNIIEHDDDDDERLVWSDTTNIVQTRNAKLFRAKPGDVNTATLTVEVYDQAWNDQTVVSAVGNYGHIVAVLGKGSNEVRVTINFIAAAISQA